MATKSKSKSSRSKALAKIGSETKRARSKASKAASRFKTVSAPHVDMNATILREKTVKNARVVVGKGTYRGATVEGTFLLAEGKEPQFWRTGELRAPVELQWFDWTPANGACNFAFPKSGYKVKEKYNGKVIAAVGR